MKLAWEDRTSKDGWIDWNAIEEIDATQYTVSVRLLSIHLYKGCVIMKKTARVNSLTLRKEQTCMSVPATCTPLQLKALAISVPKQRVEETALI